MQPGQYEEVADATELPARLRHVFWIGGGSGAGKSTIARRLADRYGWRLYATDDMMRDHAGRTSARVHRHGHGRAMGEPAS
ncbi:shikimate kinase [Streptomyces sp. V1I6]|uniref:shikimate kinase n=1 Tax=Streptomyces sp. V1I6 TaxID=3042273 RepID=UPI00277F8CD1|nr:shikimate kinase [Streptomyces sp. V1I6]MDQ0847247.1 shikimate kinase [Streptomyces sp. V1I6]